MSLSLHVIANQSTDWCGNLPRFRRFSRQCEHWLRMTVNFNLMTLGDKPLLFCVREISFGHIFPEDGCKDMVAEKWAHDIKRYCLTSR